uniref:Putative integral membrane protein n=1 Tax=Geobacillus stearothermophilus TaxID=1422 RepID=Q09LX7_GEOSE|nr:putative integral membrane protein [Geobacillus stearothermophilus]
MRTGLLDGKLYRACEWITRLAYINLLWLFFTVLGLVILGIAPATVALFTIVRKWLLFHDHDVPVLKTFVLTYKDEFWRANRIGLLLMAAAYIFYIDLLYLAHVPIEWRFPFSVALLVIFIFYTVTLLYVFPIYVHYELRFWQYIKYAFLIGMANPLMTLVMLMSVGVLFVLLMYISGADPVFQHHSLALVVMSGALRVFRKTEERLQVRKQGGW